MRPIRAFAMALVAVGFFCTLARTASIFASDPAGARAPEVITNSINMKLALVPAGEFVMGVPDSDQDANKDESPQHRVQISRPFYFGIHEVTVGNFRAFVDATRYMTSAESEESSGYDEQTQTFQYSQRGFSWRNLGWIQTDDHPVLNVNWSDAITFCEWLSQKEGRTYRLPSEAEWEYACRAGTRARFILGDSSDNLNGTANVQDQSLAEKQPRFSNAESPSYLRKPVSWNDGYPFSAPVGSFQPNGFGLYDMLGNAAEWCQDRYVEDYYFSSAAVDPKGPDNGLSRVVRGGAFLHQPRHCRVSQRTSGLPSYHNYIIGFRVVLDASDTK
jgi:formylglycine-generating enzyme required for sulfatase activity